jgi:molybdate transport system regulatory protein
MSYRRAWMLIADMNACFLQPVVETTKGGERGGGAHVTAFGHDVLKRYLAIEAKAARSIRADVARLTRLMKTG